jgi:hypothetical protein
MNKLYYLILLSLIYGFCDAQNLVPNPSFEDTVNCPTLFGQMNTALAWSDYRLSPDNFNSCNSSTVSVPFNIYDFQYAHTGNAYAGFSALYNVQFTNVSRECLGAQLLQSLTIGQKYFASFYVSRIHNDLLGIGAACNKLGIRFSTIPYSLTDPVPIDDISQVFSDSIITDTLDWVKISGSFIADSSYQYVIIGNFFSHHSVSYIQFDTLDLVAYYFVDDIVVSTDSLLTIGINEKSQQVSSILYPNPFTNEIKVTLGTNEISEITLYDVTSRIIMQQKFTNSISLVTQQLAKGIYLYEIQNKNGCKKGKIVKE